MSKVTEEILAVLEYLYDAGVDIEDWRGYSRCVEGVTEEQFKSAILKEAVERLERVL